MKGGAGDGGARQAHRLQHRPGGQHAGTAHLHHDVQHPGGLFLRRVLESHRPLGKFGGGAQLCAVYKGIYLYDRAVDVKGIIQPLLVDAGDLSLDLRRAVEGLVGDDLEPLGTEVLQRLCVGEELLPLRQLEVEHLDVQPPLGADLGVQLPQGARGGVAGVGHERLSLELPHGVDLLEYGAGHIHLAPDDEPGQLVRQDHGDGADGLQILRHVLPHPAVAPGSAPDKHAVPVLQGHG